MRLPVGHIGKRGDSACAVGIRGRVPAGPDQDRPNRRSPRGRQCRAMQHIGNVPDIAKAVTDLHVQIHDNPVRERHQGIAATSDGRVSGMRSSDQTEHHARNKQHRPKPSGERANRAEQMLQYTILLFTATAATKRVPGGAAAEPNSPPDTTLLLYRSAVPVQAIRCWRLPSHFAEGQPSWHRHPSARRVQNHH